jgi:hypothetical protein
MNKHPIFWLFFDLISVFSLLDLKRESQLIDGNFVLTGMSLKHSCHETLGEEETRQPIGVRVAIH